MLVSLMQFFNLLIAEDPSSEEIRFVKVCFGESLRFGDRLRLLYSSKLGNIEEFPEKPCS